MITQTNTDPPTNDETSLLSEVALPNTSNAEVAKKSRVVELSTWRGARWLRSLVGWIIAFAIVGAAVVAFFPSLLRREDHRASLPVEGTADAAASRVHVTKDTVRTKVVRRTVEAVGTLHGFEEFTISANVEGRVQRLLADVSDRVSAGGKLAEIDPTNFALAVRQSQRALEVELARLGLSGLPPADIDLEQLPVIREAASRLNLARNTEQRIQQLKKSNAVSAQDVDAAMAEVQAAQATHDNQLLQARAAIATIGLRAEALDIARQQLQDTEIYAPVPESTIPFVKGPAMYAVAARKVSEGTFVRVGGEIFVVVIDDALRLRVNVPERHLSEIAVGLNVDVSTAAYADLFVGKVARINPAINVSTRTFEVEVLIDNTEHRLKPGGFAKARIIINENDTAITIPLAAVTTFAGITKVFLVKNNLAQEIQVKTGVQGEDWIEIISPKLEAGENVVTSGQSALSEGTKVIVRDP